MTVDALALQSSPIITIGYLMQVIFSLAIVIAIVFAASKYLLPRLKINVPGKIIQVIDRVFLEPQVTAYVVKVGKRAWLVITSSKQVEKISEIDPESLVV